MDNELPKLSPFLHLGIKRADVKSTILIIITVLLHVERQEEGDSEQFDSVLFLSSC